VQTLLGHSSAEITLRVYAHLWPGDDDRTRSVIDGALATHAVQVRTKEVVLTPKPAVQKLADPLSGGLLGLQDDLSTLSRPLTCGDVL
jgi:hypothetical protein